MAENEQNAVKLSDAIALPRYDDGERIDQLKAENAALAVEIGRRDAIIRCITGLQAENAALAAALSECQAAAAADRRIMDLLVGREILQSIWRHGLFAPWEAESFEPLRPLIDRIDAELTAAIAVRRRAMMDIEQ
jgi:hypothetical protein